MEINILKQAVAENQILVNNTIDTIFVTRFLNGMLRIPTEIRAYSGGYPFSISGDIRSVPS